MPVLNDNTFLIQTCFNRAYDIMLVIDEGGTILEANRAAAAAYGLERSELLSLHISRLYPSNVIPELPAGAAFQKTVHRRADSSTFPVEVTTTPIRAGDSSFYLIVVRDLARRRPAASGFEEPDSFFRSVVAAFPEPVWVLDGSGNFVYVNRAFEGFT